MPLGPPTPRQQTATLRRFFNRPPLTSTRESVDSRRELKQNRSDMGGDPHRSGFAFPPQEPREEAVWL